MIVKPDFYDEFTCIAGDCPITCCQEWKITLDDGTIIPLRKDHTCPYLTKEKLCRLVIEQGDEALSETCTLFPRQIHEFTDRKEFSLVNCCPHVVDLMNEKDGFSLNRNSWTEDKEGVRNILMNLVSDERMDVSLALKMGFYILLEVEKAECFDPMEYSKPQLEKLQKAIMDIPLSGWDSFFERNELFLDITDNYSKQGLYQNFLKDKVKLAQKLEDDKLEDFEDSYEAFLGEIRTFEKLMHKYLASELYEQLVLPESSYKDMLVAYEWVTMEYITLHHALYLSYLEKGTVSYEQERECIVYVSRMTGYDVEDIEEYLRNSFENILWEWGYLAFLLG